jgi:hypothetical protein
MDCRRTRNVLRKPMMKTFFLLGLFLLSTAAWAQVTEEEEELLTDIVLERMEARKIRCEKISFQVAREKDRYFVDCFCDNKVWTWAFDSTYGFISATELPYAMTGKGTLVWSAGLNSATLIGVQASYVYADLHLLWKASGYTTLKPPWATIDPEVWNRTVMGGFNLSFVLPFRRFKIFAGMDVNFKEIRKSVSDDGEETSSVLRVYLAPCVSINYYFRTWMLGAGGGFGNTGRLFFLNAGLILR